MRTHLIGVVIVLRLESQARHEVDIARGGSGGGGRGRRYAIAASTILIEEGNVATRGWKGRPVGYTVHSANAECIGRILLAVRRAKGHGFPPESIDIATTLA